MEAEKIQMMEMILCFKAAFLLHFYGIVRLKLAGFTEIA
jgi:hypothetical protein